MNKIKRSGAAVLMASLAVSGFAQLKINEVMQSNIDCYMLEKDFPDSWVELKNTSDSPVSLKGWGLGVKKGIKKAYIFKDDVTVEPGGYIVIPCDKEEKGLHTSFRVDAGEGSVFLYSPDGEVADQLDLAKMPAPNIAIGLTGDGAWEYFLEATPGAANVGKTAKEMMPAPVISPAGGVFDTSVQVVLSAPEGAGLPDDAVLCVTTDGREPTKADAVKSLHWTFSVNESTPVRAKYISGKMLSPRSAVASYIFPDHQLTMPVVAITTNPDFLYDEEIGMLAGDDSQENPNFRQKYRRPVQVEFFEYEGGEWEPVINQLGETAIQGFSSRRHPQKSLKLYANKRFGTKSFKHTFWPDDKPSVKSVKSFSIRNAGGNFSGSHIKDTFIQNLFGRNCDHIDYQAYRPVIAYINGEYYGLIDLRERSNEDFIEANYNGLEDIYLAEDWSEFVGDGADLAFSQFNDLYSGETSTYEEMAAVMDMESFAVQYIADAFGFNIDTPHTNIIMWTPSEKVSWRWILKDHDSTAFPYFVDKSYTQYLKMELKDETGEWWLANSERGTRLFRKCLTFPEFTKLLVDRFIAFNGDFMRGDRASALVQEMGDEIKDEFAILMQYYEKPNEGPVYVEQQKNFYAERGKYMVQNFQKDFGLGEVVKMTADNTGLKLTINGHRLRYEDFDGNAYAGNSVEVKGAEGYDVKVTATDAEGVKKVVASDENSAVFIPQAGCSYHIEAVVDASVGGITDDGTLRITLLGDEIQVNGVQGQLSLEVYAVDGMLVASTVEQGDATLRISEPGVYIVKAHDAVSAKTLKVRIQ